MNPTSVLQYGGPLNVRNTAWQSFVRSHGLAPQGQLSEGPQLAGDPQLLTAQVAMAHLQYSGLNAAGCETSDNAMVIDPSPREIQLEVMALERALTDSYQQAGLQTQHALRSQEQAFSRTAAQYEAAARDIARSESAQATAQLSTD